ncbi:unnamed protein product [Clonostachys rosea f. rosea IK726]|uniref:FAD-binding domain-containing protein n=2 Tax=Bionectria ochroleuca TaxID=29856 RepID=A0A0B7KDM7_BIOOC|nr:unnamed protein product [Clonostachys rosea f. rosea IK726]
MAASPPYHHLQDKRIIVAGAGIGGLAFVVALHHQWITSSLYSAGKFPSIFICDRDPKQVSQEREGYSLSLNGLDINGGLVALRDIGLLDAALKCSLLGTDSTNSFRMWDAEWNELLRVTRKPHGGLPTAGIRIRRMDLRNILIQAAERITEIHWGTTCTSAKQLDDGRVQVMLSNTEGGTIMEEFRPEDELNYQGVVQIGGIGQFPEGNLPKPINETWGMAVSGQGVGCFMSPVDKTSAVWAISREEPEPRQKPMSEGDKQAALEEAKEIGQMLKGPFPEMIQATDPSTVFVIPARDKQPFVHDVNGLTRIVFIGDSNHAVSPFAGNGANLALKDGWDLAVKLWEHSTVREAVESYDKLAFPRAITTLKSSHQRMGIAHATGLKFQAMRVAFGAGNWLMWLFGV